MKKLNRASVSIEAAISLVVTMAVMLTLNAFIRVTYVHSVVQHALVQVGNEMATYDYVLSLLGFSEINKAAMYRTQGGAADATALTNATNNKINQFQTVLGDLSGAKEEINGVVSDIKNQSGETVAVSQEDIDNVKNSLIKTENDVSVALNNEELKKAITDENGNVKFKAILQAYINGAIGEALSEAKTRTLNIISTQLLKSYVKDDIIGTNLVYKKDVPDSSFIDGLDFGQSKYFDYPNTDTIELCCSYMVKVVSPIPVIEYVPMTNTVKVRAWQDKWSTVMIDDHKSIWWWNDDSSVTTNTAVHNKIKAHEFQNPNMIGQDKPFVHYFESNKTAVKFTAINILKNHTDSDDNYGRGQITSAISDIRNFTSQNYTKSDGSTGTITPKEVKKVKYYIYIPNTGAAMASESGQKMTKAQNSLAEEQTKTNKDDNKIKEYQKTIAECKEQVDKDKKRLTEKAKKIRAAAKELEDNFNNNEDNPFELQIIVKAVDYPE